MDFVLSSDDLKSLKIDEKDYYSRLAKGSLVHRCSDYAFYTLKEPRIMPWIRGSSTPFPFFILPKDQSIDLLKTWHYTEGTEPQAGDLIAYINNQTDKFVHVGILESSDRVISKYGILSVFSHPIEQISNEYQSSSYICFRKDGGDGVLSLLKTLLNLVVHEGIPSFNHSTCYSPFSDLGVLLELQKELVKICLDRKKEALETPPYGKSYFQTIVKRMHACIQEKFIPVTETKNTLTVVCKVEKVVNQIIETTNPMT